MDTDEIGKAPPLMGGLNLKYLATCFGSKTGTIKGITSKFDRARLRARIRFQNRYVAQWRRELLFSYGSPDGSLERVLPENREAALLAVHHSHADVQAECRELLKRPALLRGTMDDFLDPFKEYDQ